MTYKIWIVLAFLFLLAVPGWADERSGALVLSFDDGFPSWIRAVAPELEKVGGKATCFVNNQRIHKGYISFKDLLILQNQYGWEIGTHTYHHFNAVEFVKGKGLETWVAEELDRSIKELTAQGLKIHSLVFPFNAYDRVLSERVKNKFTAFRRGGEELPLAEARRADGSIPGWDIDLSGYVPLDLLFQWVEYAQAQKKILFLYGHDVLPDERFFEGRVTSVTSDTLTASEELSLTEKEGVCLVPDKDQKAKGIPLRVSRVNGKEIKVTSSDLTRLTKPGSSFILGPCYGTPLSFFRKLITFSAGKLRFLTFEEALAGDVSSSSQGGLKGNNLKSKL